VHQVVLHIHQQERGPRNVERGRHAAAPPQFSHEDTRGWAHLPRS
jgi:hypothetical protein